MQRVPRSENEFRIYSVEHPEAVISLAENKCGDKTVVKLMQEDLDKSYQKWLFKGGTIESVHCKGSVIDISSSSVQNIHISSKDDAWTQVSLILDL